MRLVSDLHIGKVNPKNLEFGLDIDPKKYDLAELVTATVRDDRIAETVANAPRPSHRTVFWSSSSRATSGCRTIRARFPST